MTCLRCRSVNHDRIEHSAAAIVTRCVRCRKPTCSDCEGADDGLRDICDTCWATLDRRIRAARDAGRFAQARAICRKWARRPWPGEMRTPSGTPIAGARTPYAQVLTDYDLDVPEAA